MKHQYHRHRISTWIRSSAQLLCVLVALPCVGCGSQSISSSADSPQAEHPDPQPAFPASASPKSASQPSATQSEVRPVAWDKLTEPGDVAREVLSYFQNHELNFGTGKLSTSDAVKLNKAEINSGKLLLTFQMTRPRQRVRFEGLQGITGNYQPHRRRIRSVTVRNASHEERFVFAGYLVIGIPHPHPEKIETPPPRPPQSRAERLQEVLAMREEVRQKVAAERARSAAPKAAVKKSGPKPVELLPGPESGYKPRDEAFSRLAAAVSGKYKMPGRNTHRPYRVQWREVAQAGVAYPSPTIQEVARAMLEGSREVREINVAAIRADLLKQAQEIERRIASGEYTRREGYRENGVVAFRTIDESGSARARAQQLRSVAAKNDVELRKWQAGQLQTTGWADLFSSRTVSRNPDLQFQHLVHEAQKVLPSEAAKHAGPRSNSSLIDLTRPESSLIRIRNASGKRLTDVILDLGVGFTRSEKRKSYGAPMLLFVPVWNPNEPLEIEFQLKEPQVIHFLAKAYANEASSEDHKFALIDPRNPPNNNSATVILRERSGFASIGKPRFAGTAWAEVDGKRTEWKDTDRPLEVHVEPGEHKVVVHAREKSERPTVIYKGTLYLDGEERKSIEVAFPNKEQAIRYLQLARQALAGNNKLFAVRYLKKAVAASPDSPAGKAAKKLLEKYGN